MSTLDCLDHVLPTAELYAVVRYDGAQIAWVCLAVGQAPAKVLLSARFSAGEMHSYIAQGAKALVMPIRSAAQPEIFGVVIDFVLPAHKAPAPRVLHLDEIRFNDGKARIFWEHDALHIAAENIDCKARFIHRITGGSIKIG